MRQTLGPKQKGAALVEYVLVLPLVLLLFLGALEVFRVMAIKQTLRAALKQELPCLTHWHDVAYREANQCSTGQIMASIASTLDSNPFARRVGPVQLVPNSDEVMNILRYGDIFEVIAEVEVEFGFLYPFEGGPTFTLRESYVTFVDSSPEYYELNNLPLDESGKPLPGEPALLPGAQPTAAPVP